MKTILIFLIVILLAVGISLLVPGIRDAIFQLAVYGRLSIGDSGPIVEYIFIQNELGDWVQCPNALCYRQVTPGVNGENVPIRAQIYDPNGDCDANYDVRFWVCKNETGSNICNEANRDTDIPTYLTGSFVSPMVNNRCNWTATYPYLDYWKRYGNWYINVSAKDTNNNSWDSVQRVWINNRVKNVAYPYPSGNIIDMGAINLGAWTDSIGANTTRNLGNTRSNVSFNSTNFSCTEAQCIATPTPIFIDGSAGTEKLCIDNDITHLESSGCGFFDAAPQTEVWWFPTNGMLRCGTDTCSDDEVAGGGNLASYTLYYHIKVSTGKTSGTYNNTIEIVTCSCDPEPCGSGF